MPGPSFPGLCSGSDFPVNSIYAALSSARVALSVAIELLRRLAALKLCWRLTTDCTGCTDENPVNRFK